MKSEKEVLELIRKKFPRQDTRINHLFEDDPDFQALCVDYFICLQDLMKHRKLTEVEKESLEDYKKALEELEKELYDFLFP